MFQELNPEGRAENSSKSLKSPQFKLIWYLGVAQLVARYLGVVEAASSSLVTQTKQEIRKNLLFSLFFALNRPFSRILRPKSSLKRPHKLTT